MSNAFVEIMSRENGGRLSMWAGRKRAHQASVADDVGREDRGETAGRGHDSGTPAMRMDSNRGSSWARYVGSSLSAVQSTRARVTVKDGLIAIPALTEECASSSRPSCARARAN